MASLSVLSEKDPSLGAPGGCGKNCGAGLEKVYPTTAVRFGAMQWLGEFQYRPGTTFRCGAKVVARTDRGTEIGQQVSLSCNGCSKQVTREHIKSYIDSSGPEFYRLHAGEIIREATEEDLKRQQELNANVVAELDHAALLAAQMQLDMKMVQVEHLVGGERIVYYFKSPGRVDFRELSRRLRAHHRRRVELRQVGARDEARLVADYEICGRECCCKNFLKKLRPVSMRMAKLQKSTLDPASVSGRCGRLRCCLRYEHEGYEDLNGKLPRLRTQVETEYGDGVVVDRQVLTQLLLVELADGRQVTIPAEEVRLAPRDKSQPAPGAAGGPGAASAEHAMAPPAAARDAAAPPPPRTEGRDAPDAQPQPESKQHVEQPGPDSQQAGSDAPRDGDAPSSRRRDRAASRRRGPRRQSKPRSPGQPPEQRESDDPPPAP